MSRIIQTVALAVFLTGCANWKSAYREFSVDNGVGAMVDIKQRAVIASKETVKVCAEPSPEALSAYAAELSAKAGASSGAALQLATALQESSAFVGLRTQSIQLLRDSMYRLCEGFLSGALNQAQYDILMRRYQKFMVALLGIEQLTGVVRVPTVIINTEGSAESELDSENSDLGGKKIEKDKKSIQEGIKSALGLTAKGSATAVVSDIGILPPRSDSHIQAVVNSVKDIVLKVVDTDDLGQVCFAYLRYGERQRTEATVDPELANICRRYFENLNDFIKKRGEAIALIMSKANEMQLSFEQLKEFVTLLKESLVDLDSTGGLLKLREPMAAMQYNFPGTSPSR